MCHCNNRENMDQVGKNSSYYLTKKWYGFALNQDYEEQNEDI